MSHEAPVFTGVAEAAAGDVEAADFCSDRRDDENRDERGQDRQSPEIKAPSDQCESAKDFQPGQIEREADTDRPWKRFVIVDVVRELDGIERFDYAGVNEDSADD